MGEVKNVVHRLRPVETGVVSVGASEDDEHMFEPKPWGGDDNLRRALMSERYGAPSALAQKKGDK